MGNLVVKISEFIARITAGKVWNFQLSINEVTEYLNKLDTNADGKITTFELLKAIIKYANNKYLVEQKKQ